MSIYCCANCDQWRDKDYSPPSESPTDKYELVCEECAAEIEGKTKANDLP